MIVQKIHISKVRPHAGNVRKGRHDPVKLAELADSIKARGILQPLIAKPAPGGTFQLVTGHRRLEAARLAGLDHLPVVLWSGTGGAAADLELMLIENTQRLNLNPMDEAEALELAHVERTEPGDDVDKARAVKVRLTHLELPEPEHEPAVRQLLQDLHTLRTAHGTLEMAMPLTHTVTRDRVARATDDMIWPPRPGDLWHDKTGRPLFAVGSGTFEVVLMTGEGETLLLEQVLQMPGGVTLTSRPRPPRADDAENEAEQEDDGQDEFDYDADAAEDDDREGAELAEDGAR